MPVTRFGRNSMYVNAPQLGAKVFKMHNLKEFIESQGIETFAEKRLNK